MGVILAPHGLRGDVHVKSFADVPADIAAYGPLVSKDGQRQFDLSIVRETQKRLTVHIKGVDDRNQAEALKGTELYIPRDRLPEPGDNTFYHTDLIGLEAITQDGDVVGIVSAVENYGASDVLEIKTPNSKDVIMIPFTDAFVPEVSLEAGTVTVVLPDEPVREDEVNTADDDESNAT